MNESKQFHPIANLFPLMSAEEFDNLRNDIEANGLHEPIWLHPDGSIIDGRNRYMAGVAAGQGWRRQWPMAAPRPLWRPAVGPRPARRRGPPSGAKYGEQSVA